MRIGKANVSVIASTMTPRPSAQFIRTGGPCISAVTMKIGRRLVTRSVEELVQRATPYMETLVAAAVVALPQTSPGVSLAYTYAANHWRHAGPKARERGEAGRKGRTHAKRG